MTIAFVIATKDRPARLKRLLDNLAAQSRRPDEVIIVDASQGLARGRVESLPGGFGGHYLQYPGKPSASAQRNAGAALVGAATDLVGFLDDDIELAPSALETMMAFWEQSATPDVAGAAFNLLNPVPTGFDRWKDSKLSHWLGLYSPEPGRVMPSGWQTLAPGLAEDTCVEWLPSGASVWRREILADHRFEEHFSGYSYLEDLDFSYAISRKYRLMIIAGAGFYHFHEPGGRISHRLFGEAEVRNRLFFVRKHGLSLARCYLGLLVRAWMTLIQAVTNLDPASCARFRGNVAELRRSLRLRGHSFR